MANFPDRKLQELRKQIDQVDEEIVTLLNRRASIVKQIAEIKQSTDGQIYVPNREKVVYEKAVTRNSGPLKPEAIRAIFREIMSACLALEKPLKIAYLGPAGTFTHQAAKEKFGSSVEYVPVKGIDAIFTDVVRGFADYGVVPIENSTEGGITDTLHMFLDVDVKVCAEIILPIRHNLMARCKVEEIKRIYSKPQVFSQCRGWLSSNLPGVPLVDVSSTTEAAQIAQEEDYAAAIAHEEAAELYGLTILYRSIEDNPHNATRFFVISKEFGKRSGDDKTSIVCFIRDEVGALFGILLPFKEHSINLTKIESFPSKRKTWDYCFFIDFEGHYHDEHVQKTLQEVKQHCTELRILGSYPRDNRGL